MRRSEGARAIDVESRGSQPRVARLGLLESRRDAERALGTEAPKRSSIAASSSLAQSHPSTTPRVTAAPSLAQSCPSTTPPRHGRLVPVSCAFATLFAPRQSISATARSAKAHSEHARRSGYFLAGAFRLLHNQHDLQVRAEAEPQGPGPSCGQQVGAPAPPAVGQMEADGRQDAR